MEQKLLGIDRVFSSKGVCKECLDHFLGHVPKNDLPVLLEFFIEKRPHWVLSKPLKFFYATGYSQDGRYWFDFGWLRKVYNLNKNKRVYLAANLKHTLPKKCENCGSVKDLVIRHKIPLSLGGSNEKENLQVLCKTCYSKNEIQLPPSVNFDFQRMLKDILEKELGTEVICYKMRPKRER